MSSDITLDEAMAVIEAARKEAEEQGSLMDIAIVDAGANLKKRLFVWTMPSSVVLSLQ